MKAEKRTVEQDVFIATDGTEFISRSECKAYEKQLERDKCTEIVRALPTVPDMIQGSDDNLTRQFYFVTNGNELNDLIKFLFNEDAIANEFFTEEYPIWVLCTWDSCGYGYVDNAEYYIGEIENSVAYMREMLHNETPPKYRLDPIKEIE